MTVKDLKTALVEIPDNLEVYVELVEPYDDGAATLSDRVETVAMTFESVGGSMRRRLVLAGSK